MKTISDGERRYLMGWLATRAGERDAGHRQWGGDLLIHELVRRSDGQLGVAMVASLLQAFTMGPAEPVPVHGEWAVEGEHLSFKGEGLGWLTLGGMDDTCLLEVTVDLDTDAEELAGRHAR